MTINWNDFFFRSIKSLFEILILFSTWTLPNDMLNPAEMAVINSKWLTNGDLQPIFHAASLEQCASSVGKSSQHDFGIILLILSQSSALLIPQHFIWNFWMKIHFKWKSCRSQCMFNICNFFGLQKMKNAAIDIIWIINMEITFDCKCSQISPLLWSS